MENRNTTGRSLTKKSPRGSIEVDAASAVTALRRLASKATRDGMARYGIPSGNALGVPVGKIRQVAKQFGRDHNLALALWRTNIYEARMLTSFLDDPQCVTPAQMDRWCRDFDSWAICDTVCFHLFDRVSSTLAFAKIKKWSREKGEFQKRAAFALLASVALHDKLTGDGPFVKCLPLIERAASDDRNFVKKGVSWALRGIGKRNRLLHGAAVALARRLADSESPAACWVGKDALRDLTKPATTRRFRK